ncbi:MAG: hypothetical protein J3R72DRAFT_506691 [Linnemannia gamsii]|nr:MAG: hypothetical protein J3R72DRAFT_506691 [Linnemannia gamsii]
MTLNNGPSLVLGSSIALYGYGAPYGYDPLYSYGEDSPTSFFGIAMMWSEQFLKWQSPTAQEKHLCANGPENCWSFGPQAIEGAESFLGLQKERLTQWLLRFFDCALYAVALKDSNGQDEEALENGYRAKGKNEDGDDDELSRDSDSEESVMNEMDGDRETQSSERKDPGE